MVARAVTPVIPRHGSCNVRRSRTRCEVLPGGPRAAPGGQGEAAGCTAAGCAVGQQHDETGAVRPMGDGMMKSRVRQARVALRAMRWSGTSTRTSATAGSPPATGCGGCCAPARHRGAAPSPSTTYEVPSAPSRATGTGVDVVEELLDGLGVEVRPGTHTVYVPPGRRGHPAAQRRARRRLPVRLRPQGAARHRTGRLLELPHPRQQQPRCAGRSIGTSLDQARAANMLHTLDLGPPGRGTSATSCSAPTTGEPVAATGFVIEHVEGPDARRPTSARATWTAWRRRSRRPRSR